MSWLCDATNDRDDRSTTGADSNIGVSGASLRVAFLGGTSFRMQLTVTRRILHMLRKDSVAWTSTTTRYAHHLKAIRSLKRLVADVATMYFVVFPRANWRWCSGVSVSRSKGECIENSGEGMDGWCPAIRAFCPKPHGARNVRRRLRSKTKTRITPRYHAPHRMLR